MEELIPINIAIGDRTFRLKITSTDEEIVRKTVKVINDKIVEFKTNFSGKDMQDYISMVLIWLATEQTKTNFYLTQLKDTEDKIVQIEQAIDKVIEAS